MVEFIELLFLTSLWIWGVHAFMELTELELIFRGTFDNKPKIPLPEWLMKPLFTCPPCCSSIHGTVSYFLFTDYPGYHAITLWIAFCFCLCGLNYIIKEHLYGS